MFEAKDRYGDRFLEIYKYDEPGGNQIDNTPAQLINKTIVEPRRKLQRHSRCNYVGNLSFMVNFYQNLAVLTSQPRTMGSTGLTTSQTTPTVYAEFVGNESRQRIIALDRGAAQAFGRDWGVIINWKYNQAALP